MASTAASNVDNMPQSFTEMEKGDVEAIGKHCQMPYCGIRDLLPFKCESCRLIYCLDHRSETSHKCPKAGEWARRRNAQNAQLNSSLPSMLDPGRNTGQPCAKGQCETRIKTSLIPGVHCSNCNREYCLKHRMEEDHDCKNLIPIGARPQNALQAQRDHGIAAFKRLKAWAAQRREEQEAKQKQKKKKTGLSSLFSNNSSGGSTTSSFAEEQALRRTAKGDASIPADKRIYLHVEASAETTKSKHPSGKFFYNKEWTVGKVLDAAAKSLQVQNVNNRGGGEEDRLRVFHVEGGRLLTFGEKIGARVKSGEMIVLLRGVGDPDLIDL